MADLDEDRISLAAATARSVRRRFAGGKFGRPDYICPAIPSDQVALLTAVVPDMATEILRRRADDLDAADRAALRWARGVADLIRGTNTARPWPDGRTVDGVDQAAFVARADRALAVLDRLVGGDP